MSLRFHEISEANHRIINPFTEEKLMLLGEVCHLQPRMRQLDLCCGKAEMLSQWSRRWGITGIGVDISNVFLEAGRARAQELGVADQIMLVQGDAAVYSAEPHSFDIVSCIGATWIGGGLVGTLEIMKKHAKPGALFLVGEPYWRSTPPEAAYTAMGVSKDEFTSLVGTLDRIESAGLSLVEMVLANEDSWDRYVAEQWMALDNWLRENPDDPDAREIAVWFAKARRSHLEYQRDLLGWGVFVMRA